MNKLCLLFTFLLITFKGFSQTGDASSVISYDGHVYANAYDEDAKLALWSQRIINNQKSIDTIAAQRYDHYVNQVAYDSSVKAVEKLQKMKHKIRESDDEMISWLTEYTSLQHAVCSVIINNSGYRRFMYTLNNRVMMSIYEPWGLDQTKYNLQNAIMEASDYIKYFAVDDQSLASAWSSVSDNIHYNKCRYNVTVDDSLFAHAGSPSNIEIFIVDKMHYNIAKTRYKTEISKGVIPANYANRKKESTFLHDYLKASLSIKMESLMYTISLGDHVGEKANTCYTSLSQIPDWYIYVFIKGKLYYVNNLPKGSLGENFTIFIPNKM